MPKTPIITRTANRGGQEVTRQVFTNKESLEHVLLGMTIPRLAEERKHGEVIRRIMTSTTKTHIGSIFKHCESPIEQMLWSSALSASLFDGSMLEFWSPPSDGFVAGKKWRTDDIDGISTARLIYQKLAPSGVSFIDFARQKEPHVPEEELRRWDNHSFLSLDFGLMFSPTVALQPSLSLAGKTIRPDAIVFVPAFPDKCVVIECDGFEFHSSQQSFTSDRARDRNIASEYGWEVRRYSGQEIFHSPVQSGIELFDYLISSLGSYSENRKKWLIKKTRWIKTATAQKRGSNHGA